MSLTVEWVPFGGPANDRLAEVVAAAKGGDPLAPVTVIVPSNPVGVWARRHLGARPGGVANVEFSAIDRLAHEWAGPTFAARDSSPLTDQVRAAAVRVALTRSPGSLSRVASHPSTDRSIAEAIEAIRRAGPDAARALSTSSRRLVRDVVHVGEEVARITEPFHDEVDLAEEATRRVPVLGAVVVHLPDWMFPGQRELLVAIAASTEVRVLLGASGAPRADRASVAWLDGLCAVPDPPVVVPPAPTEVRSVPDADDEARHVVRWLLARRAEGVPFHRMAVAYTSRAPYLRALHRHLDAAGIPSNGPAIQSVGESIAGRVVRRLLGLVESRWRREEVIALVTSGPVRSPADVVVQPARWDQITRRAGVVAGRDQWSARIGEHRDVLLRSAEPTERQVRSAQACDDLLSFVDRLAADIDAVRDAVSWSDKVLWLRGLLRDYLPPPGGRAGWPEQEQDAADRLGLTIDLLGGLDEIEPSPTWATFLAAIEIELERTPGRAGLLGSGVLVGPLASLWGADLDALAVVGLVEGRAPRRPAQGVVLGTTEHARIGADLGGDDREGQHRRYLAALASASGPKLCLWSRGDLRSGRAQYESRLLPGPTDRIVPSYAAAIDPAWVEPAATLAEHDLRVLSRRTDEGAFEAPIVAGVPRLAAGALTVAARRWGGLDRWNGLVEVEGIDAPLDRIFSATALEKYGQCGFAYFLSNVLGVEPALTPEAVLDVEPRESGSAVHQALEQLVRERIERGTAGADERARLHELLDEQLDALESRGRTGQALRWQLARERIGAQADDFFLLDDELRALGASALEAEMGFGFERDESGAVG
ncbi:MAG TPA: PD-(D/E)XK nuclease family protein, partial [Microthrixaceae bacterium]|nr:PD-(D/E)XK nuclease family protein [Microthrixaceae bacterium]